MLLKWPNLSENNAKPFVLMFKIVDLYVSKFHHNSIKLAFSRWGSIQLFQNVMMTL